MNACPKGHYYTEMPNYLCLNVYLQLTAPLTNYVTKFENYCIEGDSEVSKFVRLLK
jgi:hypothetical protein